jgi:hypothetical protein
VIRVERTAARGTTRDPRVRWGLRLDEVVPIELVPNPRRSTVRSGVGWWRRLVSGVCRRSCPGSHRAPGHCSAGTSDDADPFDAAWHTGSCVLPMRTSAWTRQGLTPAHDAALSGRAEHEHKAEQRQQGPRDLRVVDLCCSYTRIRFALNVPLCGSVRVGFV